MKLWYPSHLTSFTCPCKATTHPTVPATFIAIYIFSTAVTPWLHLFIRQKTADLVHSSLGVMYFSKLLSSSRITNQEHLVVIYCISCNLPHLPTYKLCNSFVFFQAHSHPADPFSILKAICAKGVAIFPTNQLIHTASTPDKAHPNP